LAAGTERGQYALRFDMHVSGSQGGFFAEKGNQPLENAVLVNKSLTNALGLERYYHYVGEELGSGMQHLVNVANGNSLLRWSPLLAPGRGLSTVVDITYNSLEQKSESPLGNNFSLSLSNLTRLGAPLDIHPNNADLLAGGTRAQSQWVAFIDGDGTPHRFDKNAGGGWDEPAGVHLYLRSISTDPTAPRYWAVTRPDRVTFYYNKAGYPTSVEDRNGNVLTFELEDVPAFEDPGGFKKRVKRVIDAGGRAFTLSYLTKQEVKKAPIRGRLKSISDHGGHMLLFGYYGDGNLRQITELGGTKANGTTLLPDRSVKFTYTTSDGTGPAITSAAARLDPDPYTANQSARLFSVIDARRKETTFSYCSATSCGSALNRWKLASRTDRAGNATSFAYNTTTRVTTVTAPLSRVSSYSFDTDGKVTAITNPKNETTNVIWTADRHVQKVTEPTTAFTEFAYNANGYLTDMWDQLRNRTTLEYQNVAVDASDVSGKWKPGRTIPHISQLLRKTNPKGTATLSPTSDFQWKFSYDPKGNPLTVTDPENFTTTHTYNTNGTLATTRDANNHWTTFANYDANGLPTEIRASKDQVPDANSRTTRFNYDVDGLLRWIQDARHAGDTGTDERSYRSFFDYDSYHRLGRQSTPKSTAAARGTLIWTGADYDENDNLLALADAAYGTAQSPTTGPTTTFSYDTMDQPTQQRGPDTTADPLGERTNYRYDAAGRLTEQTLPKGVQTTTTANDFTSFYAYDPLDRVIKETSHDVNAAGAITSTRNTHLCFDLAGDLVSVTAPNAGIASRDCAATPSHTTRFSYDQAHRLRSQIDPLSQTQSVSYDANDNVATVTNENGDSETRSYDQRDLLVKVESPFVKNGRTVTTKLEHDPVGKLKRSISPRAWDTSSDKLTFTDFVTSYVYDEFDELVRTDLPTQGGTPGPFFVHNAYDANGNLTTTTLPSVSTQIAQVLPQRKTVVSYWDTGWIKNSTNGILPRAHFDYTAQGWQASRTPEDANGALDLAHRSTWQYFVDGLLQQRSDRGGQVASYNYDANGNLAAANEASGIISGSNQTAYTIEVAYDGFDQLRKSRQKQTAQTNFKFTSYTYDLNGNELTRAEDGEETPVGALLSAGRTSTSTYNARDMVTSQIDQGDTAASTDDRRITNTYLPTSWDETQTLAKSNGAGGWTTEQTTSWQYFASGDLKRQELRNSGGALIESHEVSYETNGIYLNGHRTQDVFTLLGPDTIPFCRTATCTTSYVYDALDRPRFETRQRSNGTTTTTNTTEYKLDAVGNVTEEWLNNDVLRTFEYTGERDRLTRLITPNLTSRFLYDLDGNLLCSTADSWTQQTCPAAGSTSLRDRYTYDYLHRPASYQRYDGGTTPLDSATYVHDPLDRLANETETHQNFPDRSTAFTYVGLSDQVRQENATITNGSPTNRSYDYDAFDRLIGLNTGSQRLTYGRNLHGDISALLDSTDSSKAKESYGYSPYGAEDKALTSDLTTTTSGALKPDVLNPYRFNATRFDTGSGNLDMGFRQYGPNIGRFLQSDLYQHALDDLDLSADPLTGNRYGFAAGNPINFVEVDGHHYIPAKHYKQCGLYESDWRCLITEAMLERRAASATPWLLPELCGWGPSGRAVVCPWEDPTFADHAHGCRKSGLGCALDIVETLSWLQPEAKAGVLGGRLAMHLGPKAERLLERAQKIIRRERKAGRGLDDALKHPNFFRRSFPVDRPYSPTDARKIWREAKKRNYEVRFDATGHPGRLWSGPHINVRLAGGRNVHIPVDPRFRPPRGLLGRR
jgi:RHS repeat-associated protein